MIDNDNTERSQQAAVLFAAVIGGLFLTALGLLALFQIRGVFPPFIYAIIIVYILRPIVDRMVNKNIPRTIAVVIVYVLAVLALTLSVLFLVPVVVEQISAFISHFPDFLSVGLKYVSDLQIAFYKASIPKSVDFLFDEISSHAKSSAMVILTRFPQTTASLFGGVFNVVLSPIIAFYILRDLPAIKKSVIELFPERYRDGFLHVVREIDFAVGGFLRGQILISLIVGVTISIYLLIIGVNFAVLLGLLAGILNIIPYFGPVVGGGVAVIVALFQSPRLALLVVIGMIIIQQVDSAIISPTIMKHAVNLHPAVVIFSLLVGGTLFGFLGLLLAIPIAAVAKALLLHYVYAQPVKIVEEG